MQTCDQLPVLLTSRVTVIRCSLALPGNKRRWLSVAGRLRSVALLSTIMSIFLISAHKYTFNDETYSGTLPSQTILPTETPVARVTAVLPKPEMNLVPELVSVIDSVALPTHGVHVSFEI